MVVVKTINTLNDQDIIFEGAQNISITDDGLNTITFTGPDLSLFTSTAELDVVSGTLQTQIDGIDNHSRYTDSEAVIATDLARSALSSVLSVEIDSDIAGHAAIVDAHHTRYADAEAVSATEASRTSLSGSLQTQIDSINVDEVDVSSLNSLQGDLTIQGAGNVSVFNEGNNVVVSGTPAGGASGVWQEAGFATLTSDAQSVSVSNLPVFDYLKVITLIIQGDAPADTTEELYLTFNDDTGNNYLYRRGGASGFNQPNIEIADAGQTSTITHFLSLEVLNLETATKVVVSQNAMGWASATQPISTEPISGLWKNTSNRISKISITTSPTASKVKAGSFIKVLGMNF